MPAGAGAIVEVESRAKCEQGSVFSGAQLHVELRRGGRVADDELVRPGEGQPHRATETKGNQRQQRLQELDLAAETTADRHRDNPDLVLGQS